MNRTIGKVKEFDGTSGIIVDDYDNEYTVVLKNNMTKKELKVGDLVIFNPEIENNNIRFATFVRVVE